jgi:hypothetical protein
MTGLAAWAWHDRTGCGIGCAGGSVKMGYFAQHAMDLLDGDRTVFGTLAGAFGFSGDEIEKRCRVLSGAEKARLVMAPMLYDPLNFMVLDEPANHLPTGWSTRRAAAPQTQAISAEQLPRETQTGQVLSGSGSSAPHPPLPAWPPDRCRKVRTKTRPAPGR